MNFIIGFVVGVLVTAFVPELGAAAIDYVDAFVVFLKENV